MRSVRSPGLLLSQVLNALAAPVVAILLYLSAAGLGPLPPLRPTFNPGTGVWTAGADAALPKTETIRGAGLQQPVHISFESNGVAQIQAATDADMFWSMGYLVSIVLAGLLCAAAAWLAVALRGLLRAFSITCRQIASNA